MALLTANCTMAETDGLEFYSSITGTVTQETTIKKYGRSSVKLDGTSAVAKARFNSGFAAPPVGRQNLWLRFNQLPSANALILCQFTGGTMSDLSNYLRVVLTTGGKLQIAADGGSVVGSATLSANTWYRVCFCMNIVSSTNWTAKLYVTSVDGESPAADVSASNADFNCGGANTSVTLYNGTHVSNPLSTGMILYVTGVVVDNDSSNDDMGDIRCVPKLFNTESGGVQDFDTAIGNARGASDYNNVNERALSLTNGWRHNGATQVAESYGVQNAAAGDIDITGKTIIGHLAWAYGKKDALTPCTFRSAQAGTGNTTTTETLAIPSDVVTGDALLVSITSVGHTSADDYPTVTDDDSGGNTWTRITAASSTDRKTNVFWKRATSATASKTITVAGAITKLACNLVVMKDAATSTDPFINVSIETNASADETHGTFTPDVGGCAILLTIFNYTSNLATASQSTASLGAMTERAEHLSGGAGTDAGNSIATLDGTDAAAAATGSITWAQTDAATYSVALACRPEATWAAQTTKLIRNGTDVAITLTSTNALYTAIADSASYPTGVFGLKSTGTGDDTYFYEGGCIVVFDEAAAPSDKVLQSRHNNPFSNFKAPTRASYAA